jgi:hypothetical protein
MWGDISAITHFFKKNKSTVFCLVKTFIDNNHFFFNSLKFREMKQMSLLTRLALSLSLYHSNGNYQKGILEGNSCKIITEFNYQLSSWK